MYFELKIRLISFLQQALSRPIPNNFFRYGRIQYIKYLAYKDVISIELNEQEQERELSNKKYSEEDGEHYEEYSCFDFWINIRHSLWASNVNSIDASGLYFEADINIIYSILSQIYFMTDILGEPSFEDTKKIEWDLDPIKNKKVIILLPSKINKNQRRETGSFSILVGTNDFFDNYDVWKNGA